ncbi:HNH endonuclease [Bacillus paramycoides]|uniref:HNH endonuclease n=1 Tax=Bacillus paramycoides TaxID=2026194 RepID=UPI003D02C65B
MQAVAEWIEYDDVNLLEKCSKPHKKTLLHDYIEFIYYTQYEYTLDKYFPINVINQFIELLEFYQIDYTEIGKFEHVGCTDDDLNAEEHSEAELYADKLFIFFKEKLGPLIIDDIFTVLFANKHFLFEFNRQLMDLIQELAIENHPEYLKKDGVIKRCDYIPQWLKRGVFMRDKGRCQICGTDLKRILQLDNKENYDHIIPLERGGINDPTNFQLACEHCNKSKGARSMTFNSLATRFWDIES